MFNILYIKTHFDKCIVQCALLPLLMLSGCLSMGVRLGGGLEDRPGPERGSVTTGLVGTCKGGVKVTLDQRFRTNPDGMEKGVFLTTEITLWEAPKK